MPPIKLHTEDPISSKPSEALASHTSTDAVQAPSQYTPATTTSSQTSSHGARPGAPAVPAPTAAINQPRTQFSASAPPPTRTTAIPDDNGHPPAPQPGAIPTPLTAAATTSKYAPPTQTATPSANPTMPLTGSTPTQMPAQFHMAPPTMNLASTHSTDASTYQAPSNDQIPQPQPIQPSAAVSLSHPPGYQQNASAVEMTAAQRDAQDRLQASESSFVGIGNSGFNNNSGGLLTGSAPGVAPGVGTGASSSEGVDMAQAWNGVKGLMNTAGKKLAEVEGEIWKRVGNQ